MAQPLFTNMNQTDNNAVSQIRQQYQAEQALFQLQPALIQRFIEGQARQVADACIQHLPRLRFLLPDQVVVKAGEAPQTVPAEMREQMIGGFTARLTGSGINVALRQRLVELENHNNPAVAVAAGVLRHATAMYMVYNLLPSGRTVNYVAAEGEEIPSLPAENNLEAESAITAATDAIAEEGQNDEGRGQLLVPYVPAARRFYLPQWVAFDEEDRLLVGNISEAEAHLESMQRFLAILHGGVSLAPYIVADKEYQQKRYGMLGQIVNQGRALARYLTREIVQTIQRRAAGQDLNRGLSLSLPYFDDQDLVMKTHNFEVIPAGRIMFVPAFVVRASREEQAKVAQDTRLNPSTRKHLLFSLKLLEQAFEKR